MLIKMDTMLQTAKTFILIESWNTAQYAATVSQSGLLVLGHGKSKDNEYKCGKQVLCV